MSASGYGVKNLFNGEIDVRTVSPTETAARVNWLIFTGTIVTASWTDDHIEEAFERHAQSRFKVVPVRIKELPQQRSSRQGKKP